MKRPRRTIHSDESGGVMVSFLLTLPVFWFIIAIFVQLALLCTARLYVNHAAQAAARSAMVTLAENGESYRIQRAAAMSLAPISPRSGAGSGASRSVVRALYESGLPHAGNYTDRYGFAEAATNVFWRPNKDRYHDTDGETMTITVRYQFYLTVPIASRILSRNTRTIAGVNGRFVELERSITFERVPGRVYGRTKIFELVGLLTQ